MCERDCIDKEEETPFDRSLEEWRKKARKNIEKREAQDLSEIEPVSVKVEVKGIGIEILIHTQDPCDAMIISGRAIETLRYVMKTEPKAVVLP